MQAQITDPKSARMQHWFLCNGGIQSVWTQRYLGIDSQENPISIPGNGVGPYSQLSYSSNLGNYMIKLAAAATSDCSSINNNCVFQVVANNNDGKVNRLIYGAALPVSSSNYSPEQWLFMGA